MRLCVLGKVHHLCSSSGDSGRALRSFQDTRSRFHLTASRQELVAMRTDLEKQFCFMRLVTAFVNLTLSSFALRRSHTPRHEKYIAALIAAVAIILSLAHTYHHCR